MVSLVYSVQLLDISDNTLQKLDLDFELIKVLKLL